MDIFRTFERANVPSKYDIAMMRLCSGKPSLHDEGFESLLQSPPTIPEMRDYFAQARDSIEAEITQLQVM